MRERFKETQNTQSFIPSFGLNSSVILIKLVQRAQSALAKDNAAGSANRSLRHLPSPPRHIAFPPPFLGSRRRLTLGKRGRGERGGGRSAGRPGAPARSLTRAPASPGRAAPRSGAGRWCCGGSCAARLARKVRAGSAAASFRSLWVDDTAGPPRRGPPVASGLPAQRRSAPAGPGPAPPRLRPRRCALVARARGPPGRAAGAADRRLRAS